MIHVYGDESKYSVVVMLDGVKQNVSDYFYDYDIANVDVIENKLENAYDRLVDLAKNDILAGFNQSSK